MEETGDDSSTETKTEVLSVGLPEIAVAGSIVIAINVVSVGVGFLDSSEEIVADGSIEMSTEVVSVGAGVSEICDAGSIVIAVKVASVGMGILDFVEEDSDDVTKVVSV